MALTTHYRLYEFAKTALIKIFAFPYATVCDLYSDGGEDVDKWIEAQIGHYVGISSSATGTEQWENHRKPYIIEFIESDPCSDSLEYGCQDKGIAADIVCCMNQLQACFECEETARKLLNNASSLLKPGGYFFGIITDSSMIWTKYQKNVEAAHNKVPGMKANAVPNCIRSDNYIITFEVEEEKFPLFGKKYELKFANDSILESHYLVHFPSLIRLARDSGLEYVEIQNLTEFYDDNRMQFAAMIANANLVDPRGRLLPRAFDILGLYCVFVFQKPDPDAAPPISTPLHLHDDEQLPEELQQQHQLSRRESWRSQSLSADADERQAPPMDTLAEHEKGILGPPPQDVWI